MFNKRIPITMRLVAGLLATTVALTLYFIAATGVLGMVGTLAALSYSIADGIDLYSLINS